MTTLAQQMKRKSLIKQLNQLGIHNIEGQALEDVMYSALLRTLAVKRATQD